MTLAKKLIERIDSLINVEEVFARRVVSFSGGKRHIKIKCGPGYKLVNNMCQRMKSSEILSRRRGARKGKSLRRAHMMQTNRKRALTLRRRHSAGL